MSGKKDSGVRLRGNKASKKEPTAKGTTPPEPSKPAADQTPKGAKQGDIPPEWVNDRTYPSLENVLRELIPAIVVGALLYFGYPYYKTHWKDFHNVMKGKGPGKFGTDSWYPTSKAQVKSFKIFYPENLTVYDGVKHPRIYLSFLGEVFDVTVGDQHYGKKDGGYHFFATRDASRAYVTGQFNETGLIDDVSDFDLEQVGGLLSWYDFYHNHEEYFKVGVLVGRYYTAEGKQTKALQKIRIRFNQYQAWTKEQEEMKKSHPDCNMQSWENKNADVWCERGVPRRIRYGMDKGLDKARCACYPTEEIEAAEPEHALLYPNCSKFSTRCSYMIKDMQKRIIDTYPESAEAQQMLGLKQRVLPAPIK